MEAPDEADDGGAAASWRVRPRQERAAPHWPVEAPGTAEGGGAAQLAPAEVMRCLRGRAEPVLLSGERN